MSSKKSQENVNIGIKLIDELTTDAYELQLEAHDNQLECRASITVHDTGNSIPPAELISLLRKNDIARSVDLEQVAIFCTEAAQGENPQNFVLARGIKPIDGEDGWFELVVATGEEEAPPLSMTKGALIIKQFKASPMLSKISRSERYIPLHQELKVRPSLDFPFRQKQEKSAN